MGALRCANSNSANARLQPIANAFQLLMTTGSPGRAEPLPLLWDARGQPMVPAQICHLERGPSPPKLLKGLDGCVLIVRDFKHGNQLRDLENIVDVLGQVHQLETAALVAYG